MQSLCVSGWSLHKNVCSCVCFLWQNPDRLAERCCRTTLLCCVWYKRLWMVTHFSNGSISSNNCCSFFQAAVLSDHLQKENTCEQRIWFCVWVWIKQCKWHLHNASFVLYPKLTSGQHFMLFHNLRSLTNSTQSASACWWSATPFCSRTLLQGL